MKKYYYEEAYTGNYEVTTYEDGIIVDSEIVAYYELDGYIERLAYEGYTFGYPEEVIDELTVRCAELERELAKIKAILADKTNRIR